MVEVVVVVLEVDLAFWLLGWLNGERNLLLVRIPLGFILRFLGVLNGLLSILYKV